MSEQPTAMRLVERLQSGWGTALRDECASELRRLHAENEALRSDAERYRWLRDNSNNWS